MKGDKKCQMEVETESALASGGNELARKRKDVCVTSEVVE